MASNNIHGKEQVDEVAVSWGKLAESIKKTADNVVSYHKKVSSLPSDYLKSAEKQRTTQVEMNKAATDAIGVLDKKIALEKEEARIKKALITQNAKLTQSTSKEAQELAKVRYETQQNNKSTKEAAILSSKLATEYQKLVIKMNQAAATVQNLNAKRLQGKKLTDIEQRELQQSTIQFTKYQTAVRGADASIGRFQRNVGNYPKGLRAAAGAARSLASAMGLLGGAFLVVQTIRGAISTIREFDRQIIAVKKTTNLSTEEIKLFKEEVIDLGLKTKGVSIQGLLQSSEVAGQLGVKGRANILKFSKTIEQLKLTSDIAGEASVRNFAKFIEVSTDTVENADKLGSVITELGNNFATTESQILSNATEIQKGLSIYDASAEGVLGLGAATSALGNEAEVSSGALQKTFKILNDGASSGKNLQKILEITGQTAEEFREEFGRDSVSVFRKFIKGLSDTEKEGKNLSNTMTELGINNLRTTRVVGSLAKNYDILDDALNRANKEYIENNALTKEADESAKSLDSQIGDLSDSWDGFILSLDGSEGVITKIFSKIIGFLGSVLEGIRLLNLGAKGREGELLANITSNAQNKELKELNENAEKFGTTLEHEAKISKANSEAKIKQIKDEIAANEVLIAQKDKIFDGSLNVTERSDLDDRIKEAEKAQIGLNRNLATYNGVLAAANEILKENSSEIKKNADVDSKAVESKKKSSKELVDYQQKLKEQEISDQINHLDRIIKEDENANHVIIQAIKDRMILEMDLAKTQSEFLIASKKLTGDALVLEEEQLQSKLVDIILDSQEQIKKASQREETREPLDNEEDRLDSKGYLIDKLVEIEAGGYDELNKLYEDDFDAFMDLVRKKLLASKSATKEMHSDVQAMFSDFGAMYGVDASKFQVLFDGKENTEQQWASASIEATRGLYNLFSQNYTADLERYREAADLQLSFLGDNEAAKEEIERQYAERSAKLREKQAKADRDAAIFNIILNTAQAIVGLWVNPGFPAAIPLAIAMGVLGAAQIAAVASQPLPQYYAGTNSAPADTLATIDEKGAEIHTDSKGNIKSFGQDKGSRFTHVAKGDKIYTASKSKQMKQDFNKDLQQMLNFSGIMPFSNSIEKGDMQTIKVENNGLTSDEFNNGINSLKSTINNKESFQFIHDEKGTRKYRTKQNAKTLLQNNRVHIKGKGV